MEGLRKNLSFLREYRKALRLRATRSERLLWKCVRKKQFGFKFRRQESIGRYIVDFYCDSLRLVVELDGATHENELQKKYDKKRQNDLERSGYTVVRYTDDEVLENFEFVITDLQNICHNIHTQKQ